MKMYRRHPADVTADRLVHDYERYYDDVDEGWRIACERVIEGLRQVAIKDQGDGDR